MFKTVKIPVWLLSLLLVLSLWGVGRGALPAYNTLTLEQEIMTYPCNTLYDPALPNAPVGTMKIVKGAIMGVEPVNKNKTRLHIFGGGIMEPDIEYNKVINQLGI